MKDRASLQDVANRAGVHRSTASRILNHGEASGMRRDTIERVLEAAGALHYSPSAIARALKSQRTFAVGVAVPDLTNPVFPPVVRGLEDTLGSAGYTLMLSHADTDILKERAVVHALLKRQVDGVILLTAQIQDPITEELVAQSIPTVLVGRVTQSAVVASVSVDDAEGSRLAVEHLVGLGHRRIAYVGGPQHVSTGRRRYEGYRRAMEDAGAEIPPTMVGFAAAFDDESGATVLHEILEWGEPFTAVVTASDAIALGCLDVLADSGMRLGVDISLTGFGGTRLVSHLRPSLTSVRLPYTTMGTEGARLMLEELSGQGSRQQVILRPELHVGASTAPPAF